MYETSGAKVRFTLSSMTYLNMILTLSVDPVAPYPDTQAARSRTRHPSVADPNGSLGSKASN